MDDMNKQGPCEGTAAQPCTGAKDEGTACEGEKAEGAECNGEEAPAAM